MQSWPQPVLVPVGAGFDEVIKYSTKSVFSRKQVPACGKPHVVRLFLLPGFHLPKCD